MKKLVITTACLLAFASGAFAQGKLNWSSVSPSAMTAQTNSTTYSVFTGGGSTGSGGVANMPGAASGSFYFALLYSNVDVPVSGPVVAKPTTLTALNSWSDSGLRATNGSSASRLAAVTPGTSVTVPWAVGTTQNVMMVGWSANLGTTWTAVLAKLNDWQNNYVANAFFGTSTTGYIAAGGGDPGTTVFATAPLAGAGTPIFSLNTQLYLLNSVAPIPEPSTLALAALGGASLLLFRRRK